MYPHPRLPRGEAQDRFKSLLLDEGLSSFYWALNPNSGDTGGLLLPDWRTPHRAKARLLAGLPASPPLRALAGVRAAPCPRDAAPDLAPRQSDGRFFRCATSEHDELLAPSAATPAATPAGAVTASTDSISGAGGGGAGGSGAGSCIHVQQVCNGVAECADGSDEDRAACKAAGRKRKQPCLTVGGRDPLRPCALPFE